MKYSLLIGGCLIDDIMAPHHTEIDYDAIDERLRRIHRFSNDPRALTVDQHRRLVRKLAAHAGEDDAILQWCYHHDDHEAITGDIPGPLKALIAQETGLLHGVEIALDRAICEARCLRYPDDRVRRTVHKYDKAAEAIEWVHKMGQAPAPWNAPMGVTDEFARELLAEVRAGL